ncbi:uncharacterized protein BDZ83DRAFT_656921 [Colletotrichum acutatum]|uniref:Uncharacterized protein n=1 Tax=Glomerella acutata TaxID=27357 RepID=A0AAD8XAD0_GLOAC|nr:uncharacterized protein BDZ83DRAFT_656921 [Colletotrichum acutatum]KAK1711203.1 hypothetical protein BDZ83DRAFT_656921 [Colletotrichum acutatum]
MVGAGCPGYGRKRFDRSFFERFSLRKQQPARAQREQCQNHKRKLQMLPRNGDTPVPNVPQRPIGPPSGTQVASTVENYNSPKASESKGPSHTSTTAHDSRLS